MRMAFSVGRLLFLNAPSAIYRLILSRATQPDWHILSRQDVRRNLIDGVAEGLRPGVRGAIQEMKIFGRPWNIPFAAIRAPTFLWQGTGDRNVPVAAALHLAELIPNCRLFKMEGAGHYWIFDHIEDVLHVLKKEMAGYRLNLSRVRAN
jgi:pimeloyl-ACP methyl ester carboxylesterase